MRMILVNYTINLIFENKSYKTGKVCFAIVFSEVNLVYLCL